ncbi:hypothetical protein D1159_09280 [Pseudoflavonifractor sp. 524-17]|uniref:DUF5682 family protein n=1 Tax=Pseudoflavonifractor sp. 524-17 TaxID=2304577 RepID=UPI00137A6CAE|nr:DUF5682 family protein [Pseudoflavonifractor sp. 524-17]NCE64776.1 hypothetical protein [Pseudoflavonifractor sp. 524-17]
MGGPVLFGVRHLSPAAAYHLRRALDEANPALVLVEGPSDLSEELHWFCHPQTKLPAAILAYTQDSPVRTILYPFAEYSPEYQAILWAHEHGVPCRFMDLPSSVFLALGPDWAAPKEDGEDKDAPPEEAPSPDIPTTEWVYRRLETVTGEDHDAFWERRFEQLDTPGAYRDAANTFGRELRRLAQDSPRRTAENQVREAYMKRTIQKAVETGVPAERIFCVCGAFHVEGLEQIAPMTDEEQNALPRAVSHATLMPYSYYRLSTRAGYGAGNQAPAYFELLWEALHRSGPGEAAYLYLTALAAAHRGAGNLTSSAEVIEAVRLAHTLAGLRGSKYPCRADLRDAAVACMGHGHFSELAAAAAQVEIGTKIGALPDGVSRTSIQADFYRQLKDLKLEPYRTAQAKPLDLDLREKLTVKSEAAAFLDLNRSLFLHRLRVLGVRFAVPVQRRQEKASWGEYWTLQWTPEAEIEIVESALLGDTVEGAASFALRERAEASTSMEQAASLFGDAFLCGMPAAAGYILSILQRLSVDAAAVSDIAGTAAQLSLVIRYGDLRRFDAAPLIPLLSQLYLRACLTLEDACICDNSAADGVMKTMDSLNAVQLNHDFLDETLWLSLLSRISDRDDLNTCCSGFAMATLLERGKAEDALLEREVARRLSPGIPADLGCGWFEGLARKNRPALITRLSLWRELSGYLDQLDDDAFKRALVFLRRAFCEFTAGEKADIAENLGEIWGLNAQQTADALLRKTTQEEQALLADLDEFDFDGI